MASTRDRLIEALHASHHRLAHHVGEDDADIQSYCTDWSIADLLSHLGSGAEIHTLVLDAGLTGGSQPGADDVQPIWDRWNAKSPTEKVRDGLAADQALIDRIDALDEAERDGWHLDLYGAERDLEGFIRLRGSEHAVHTWDALVALDPTATVDATMASFMLDQIGWIAGFVGRPTDPPSSLRVTATDDGRVFELALGPDQVSLTEAESAGDDGAELRLPAEALVRLVYGRLDADHTPPLEGAGYDLDALRRSFPGV